MAIPASPIAPLFSSVRDWYKGPNSDLRTKSQRIPLRAKAAQDTLKQETLALVTAARLLKGISLLKVAIFLWLQVSRRLKVKY
jgi:hypothetical protein